MRQYTQKSASVLKEERALLAYFQKSTFDNPVNFETELRHLLTGNYGEILQRRALLSQQPRFRGEASGKIVSVLAQAWEVPPQKVFALYNALPEARRLELNALVDRVALDLKGQLADEICYANVPDDHWEAFKKEQNRRRASPATPAGHSIA